MAIKSISRSISAGAPPGKVWAVLADIEHWARWYPAIRMARWTGDKGWKPGRHFLRIFDYGLPILPTLAMATVVEVEPERSMLWHERTPGIDLLQGYQLRPDLPHNTYVTIHQEASGMLVSPLWAVMEARIAQSFEAALAGLKKELEASD